MQVGYPAYGAPPGQQGGAPLNSPFGGQPPQQGQVRSSPFAGGAAGAGGFAPPGGAFPPPPPAAGGAPLNSPFGGEPPPQAGVRSSPFAGGAGAGGFAPPPTTGAAFPPPPTSAATSAGSSGGFAPPPTVGAFPAPPPTTGGACGVAAGGFVPPGQDHRQDEKLLNEHITVSNSPAAFMRATVSKFPSSVSGKQKLNMPLGLILQPLAPVQEEVPSINFGAVGTIVRCKTCRSYINPFVQWQSNGRQWTCNLCGLSQATPDTYYSSLDETGKRMDRHARQELSKGAVEYIAPGEYMVRPPQPPVFLFLIDVSYTAVATGMLDTVVTGIKEAIQSGCMPGGERMQMGIITYDSVLHFYNLNSSLSQPQMLVVSDLEDMFLPLANDILVSAPEGEAAILNLLDSLPAIFADTKVNESCLGSAVRGAFMAMKNIGGKMMVFSSVIPSLGSHALKSTRDNPRLLNTDREVELLRPVNDEFKELAKELAGVQITVELFLATQAYVDMASLAPLAKYTAGDIHWYPQFTAQTQGMKLRSEIMHVLTRYMGWEAVMRIRVSRGWKITNTFGHFFVRGSDLLVVPNCHSDQTFAITMDMEENVTPDPVLCVQSALLYTNSDGERRIRVHTWAALTTQNFSDIVNSVDVQATAAILANLALENSVKPQSTLAEGRNSLHRQCQQIVSMSNMMSSEALQFLPLYIMGMLKSTAFRATNDISADYRTYLWMRMETLSVSQLAAFFYPRMMALHNMPDTCGVPDEYGQSTMPDMLNLTNESLTQDGIFLLEDGESILLWVGRGAQPGFLSGVFGARSFDELDPQTAENMIGNTGDATSTRVANVIRQVRVERSVPYLQLHILRQGDPKEARFFASLIEDRTHGLQSTYTEFLQRMGYRPQQAAPARG
mmetsp:Transcript_23392/g.43028  ORF Transcript_23392/g.43028 Transcript_23392/m.43028 type:complete len:895 (-) Transcript_23392:139-2823(-)